MLSVGTPGLTGVKPTSHLPITKWENATKHIAITLAAIAAIALAVGVLGLVNWQGFMSIGAFSSNAAFWTMVGAAGLCVATAAGSVAGFIHHAKKDKAFTEIRN